MNRPPPPVTSTAYPSPAPWAREFDLSGIGEAEAAFLAGAALQVLDGLIRSAPASAGLWRSRLALKAAAFSCALLGQPQDERALRDVICLTRPGGDPGPAGRILLAWRKLIRHSGPIDGELLATVAGLFGLKLDFDIEALAAYAEELAGTDKPGPFAATEAAQHASGAFSALNPPAELFGFWLADLVIARRLGWPQPVPLLVVQVQKSFFRNGPNRRRIRIGEAGWARAALIAYGQAALEAHDLAVDAARRAERLKAVSPKLRAKGASGIIEALLQEDALLPSACAGATPGTAMTDRAVRRLFERLTSLNAVRELTGRSTFRLYGL
jgi:hypothetical protein